jgi:hypothetical protein
VTLGGFEGIIMKMQMDFKHEINSFESKLMFDPFNKMLSKKICHEILNQYDFNSEVYEHHNIWKKPESDTPKYVDIVEPVGQKEEHTEPKDLTVKPENIEEGKVKEKPKV